MKSSANNIESTLAQQISDRVKLIEEMVLVGIVRYGKSIGSGRLQVKLLRRGLKRRTYK